MSNVIDMKNIDAGYRGYPSGNFRKASIIYNRDHYLLKYPERNKKKTHETQVSSYMNNSISEYIGSHIFNSVGIPAQETLLGILHTDSDSQKDIVVVACKDFVNRESGYELQEFVTLAKLYYSTSELGRSPSAEKVYEIINNHYSLSGIKDEAIKRYWDTHVIDALIGNFDRHAGNWGYIIDTRAGDSALAPVYDCGSSLWAKTDDAAIPSILTSRELIDEFIYDFPKGQIKLTESGNKYSYLDLFSSDINSDCKDALLRVFPKINIGDIHNIIDRTPFITNERAEYLSRIIDGRYHNILEVSYEKQSSIGNPKGKPAEYKKAPDTIHMRSGIADGDIEK